MGAPKGIDWSNQPLGLIPDVDLARQLGVCTSTIRYHRKQQGIKHPNYSNRAGLPLRVLRLLRDCKPWNTSQIVEALDCDPGRLRSLLHEMCERGEIKRHRERSHTTLYWALPHVEIGSLPRYKRDSRPSMKATYTEATQEWSVADPVVDVGAVALVGIVQEDQSDRFRCTRKRRDVSLQECINLFGDVHAYERSGEPCFGCKVGAMNRVRHCYELEPTDQVVADMLRSVTKNCRFSTRRLERAYGID